MTNLVSVVIPAYKAASIIRRAIDSVCAQTLPPGEILVVDDGGFDADELSRVLQPYAGRATLLRQSHGGVASARNFGIASARSEWIAFLDADDYWEPTKLARQMAIPAIHPDVALIACRYWIENPGSNRQQAGSDRFFGRLLRLSGREVWDAAMTIWTGTVIARRSVLASQRFQSRFEPAEDRDLWVRLLAAYPAYCVPELLATYVQHSTSLSNAAPEWDCQSMLAVVRNHSEILGFKGTKEQEEIIHRRLCGVLLARGNYPAAVRPALRRLRINPFSLQGWRILAKVLILSGLVPPPRHQTSSLCHKGTEEKALPQNRTPQNIQET